MQIHSLDTNKYFSSKTNYTQLKNISFGAQDNKTDFFNNKELELAKEYLCKDDWEKEYFQKRLKEIYPNDAMDHADNHPIFLFISASLCFIPTIIDMCLIDPIREKHVKNLIQPEIRRIKELMIEINNSKLEQLTQEIKRENKIVKILKKDNENKKTLYKHFIKLLSNSENAQNLGIPTAIMIEGTNKKAKKDIMDWTKEQILQRTVEFTLPEDEDEALYRISTEIDYAQDYFDKTGKRSVLFVENLQNILNSNTASNETIAEMKTLLSDISEDKVPVTIIFDVNDSSDLDKAFTGNKSRIPICIKLENR